MRFDKLTLKSQEALSEAQSLATSRGHSQITPAHLLRALVAQPEGSTVPILQKIGVAVERVQSDAEKRLAALPKVSGGAQPTISPALQRALDGAFKEAEKRKDEYVSTEHLLLALADEVGLDLPGQLDRACHLALAGRVRRTGRKRAVGDEPEGRDLRTGEPERLFSNLVRGITKLPVRLRAR